MADQEVTSSSLVGMGLRQPLAERDEAAIIGFQQLFGGYRLWCLVIYSVLILLVTGAIAVKRHLWWDEIVVYYIATLPNPNAMWDALLSGADWQTPTYYFILHYLSAWFGPSPLVLRSIAIIPYWLATLVLYFTVARRTSPLYGFLAMLFPSLTIAFNYSFEARPYALVLLFTACTFLSWQLTKEERFRRFALPALCVSLAATVCVHYNACLIVLPILAGEAVLALRKRRVDFPVLISIFSAALPVMLLLPHILTIKRFAAMFSADTNFEALAEIYVVFFLRFMVLAAPIGTASIIWLALPRSRRHENGVLRPPENKLASPTIVAATTFLTLPIIYFALSFVTHTLHVRYVLETVIGAAICFALALYSARHAVPHLAGIMLVVLALGVSAYSTKRLRGPDETTWRTFAAYSELFDRNNKAVYDSNNPLLLGGGSYLIVFHYGNEDLRRRSFYLISDPGVKIPWLTQFSRITYTAFKSILPGQMQVPYYSSFLRQHEHFLVYDPEPWLLNQLVSDGYNVRVQKVLEHGPLYSVTVK